MFLIQEELYEQHYQPFHSLLINLCLICLIHTTSEA